MPTERCVRCRSKGSAKVRLTLLYGVYICQECDAVMGGHWKEWLAGRALRTRRLYGIAAGVCVGLLLLAAAAGSVVYLRRGGDPGLIYGLGIFVCLFAFLIWANVASDRRAAARSGAQTRTVVGEPPLPQWQNADYQCVECGDWFAPRALDAHYMELASQSIRILNLANAHSFGSTFDEAGMAWCPRCIPDARHLPGRTRTVLGVSGSLFPKPDRQTDRE